MRNREEGWRKFVQPSAVINKIIISKVIADLIFAYLSPNMRTRDPGNVFVFSFNSFCAHTVGFDLRSLAATSGDGGNLPPGHPIPSAS